METREKTMVPPKYDECLQVAESHGTGTGVREETDEARERDRGGGGVLLIATASSQRS